MSNPSTLKSRMIADVLHRTADTINNIDKNSAAIHQAEALAEHLNNTVTGLCFKASGTAWPVALHLHVSSGEMLTSAVRSAIAQAGLKIADETRRIANNAEWPLIETTFKLEGLDTQIISVNRQPDTICHRNNPIQLAA
jgi:hypothetical protein